MKQSAQGTVTYFVWFNFLIVGCSSLLPWNATITATQFFKYKFCGTEYEHLFESYFTSLFTLAQLLGLICQLYMEAQYSGYENTITKPLFASCALFSILTISCFFDLSGVNYFYFCVPVVFLLGYATIYLTSGVFARSASYQSTSLSQGAMVGQAIAGVFVSLLSYMLANNSTLGTTDDEGINDVLVDDVSCNVGDSGILYSAQLYFGIVAITMWISLFLFVFSKSNYLIFYKTIQEVYVINNLLHDMPSIPDRGGTMIEDSRITREVSNYGIESVADKSSSTLLLVPPSKSEISEILEVVFELKFFMIIIMVTFLGTLSIFPALVAEIWDCGNINNASFTGLLFLIFNIADSIGRALSSFAHEFSLYLVYFLIIISFGKMSLIPLLTRADIHGDSEFSCQNLYPVLLVFLLGITNGFCASCCMMHWSKALCNPLNEHIGATLMILSISIGLTLGSMLSYFVVDSILLI